MVDYVENAVLRGYFRERNYALHARTFKVMLGLTLTCLTTHNKVEVPPKDERFPTKYVHVLLSCTRVQGVQKRAAAQSSVNVRLGKRGSCHVTRFNP